jgi:hypothetical protein
MTGRPLLVGVFLSATAGTLCRTAPAQDANVIARAKVLFEDGKRLLNQKEYNEACRLLDESFRLASASGPLLALAMCHEGQGKIATAWSEYKETVARARTLGQTDWTEKARLAALALESRLPRITVVLDPEAARIPGLVVRCDGLVLGAESLGVPAPLDPGAHTIDARAPEYQPWAAPIVAREGQSLSVTVPPLWNLAPPTSRTDAPESRMSPLRTIGILSGAAGLVALGVGSYFAVRAIDQNHDSNLDCTGNLCNSNGTRERLDAISSAKGATAAFIVGGVSLAAGITLFVVGRSRPAHTAFAAGAAGDAQSGRLIFCGTF